MAVRKIDNSIEGAADWTPEIESKNLLKRGFYNVAFTEMHTSVKPEIIAGSSVDVGGFIFVFDTSQVISGVIGVGNWYVIIDDVGAVSFTDTPPPVYDQEKNGFYDIDGSRYILAFTAATTTYNDKYNLDRNYFNERIIVEGSVSSDTIIEKTSDAGVTVDSVLLKDSLIDTGQGLNAVVSEDVYFDRVNISANPTYLPDIDIKQTGHIAYFNGFGAASLRVPAVGVYSVCGSVLGGEARSYASISGLATFLASGNGDYVTVSYRRIS